MSRALGCRDLAEPKLRRLRVRDQSDPYEDSDGARRGRLMFDTFLGLPLHVLVLHFTVVLVPISAIATTAVFLYRPWRAAYGARMVVGNLAMLALTFVTVRAGLDLQARYR